MRRGANHSNVSVTAGAALPRSACVGAAVVALRSDRRAECIREPVKESAKTEHVPPTCKAPLAIDLFSGLGGWAEGLEAEGFHVRRYDLYDMFAETGTPKPEGLDLVLRDVMTIHGAELAGADIIVASPPCQEFSWMAMPWSRAKQVARALRGEGDFPDGYKGSRTIPELRALFDACFRIQCEASEAAGRHIPMVVENVRGAQPWVGRAAWNFGSFYLWGDVPALMPGVFKGSKNGELGGGSWFAIGSPGQKVTGQNPDGRKVPGFRFDGSGGSFQTASVEAHVAEGRKGAGAGAAWFDGNLCVTSSKSSARKAASARIAKIPLTLSKWVGSVYYPKHEKACV